MGNNFDRRINLIINELTFDSSNFYIDFVVEKSDKDDLNVAEITLYNVSKVTREKIQKDQTVILNAGYGTDIGAIFIGLVGNVKYNADKSSADTVLTLLCVDGKLINDKFINKTYIVGTTARQIIDDMIKFSGLESNIIDIQQDVVYSNGKVVYGNLRDQLASIVRDTLSRLTIKNNIINVIKKLEGTVTSYVVSALTGLLEPPSRLDDDSEKDIELHSFKSLLNHNLDVDNFVSVESETLNGDFKIFRVKHTGSLDGEFISEVEVITG